jgi:hypothetical protein
MKKYFSIFALFFAGILFGCSQNSMQEKRVNKIIGVLQQSTKMTPEQAAKVQPMVQNFVSTNFANRKQYGDDKAGLKTANQANRKTFLANLSTVLTDDQVKQYEDYVKQQHQQKMGKNQGNSDSEEGGNGGQ